MAAYCDFNEIHGGKVVPTPTRNVNIQLFS